MKKTIVIIIMTVIILGLGGYIAYDKLYTVKEEDKHENSEKIKTSTDESKIQNQEVDNKAEDNLKDEGETITQIIINDYSNRTAYIENGSLKISDANTLALDSKIININYSRSCSGYYNIFLLTENGKVYSNSEITSNFFKYEPVNISKTKKIVSMKGFDQSSTSCNQRGVYFIGESGKTYEVKVDCSVNGNYVESSSLIESNGSHVSDMCNPK